MGGVQAHAGEHRREAAVTAQRDQACAIFRAVVWKLKVNGNRMKSESWAKRDAWISDNKSLVYWSKREKCPVVYYTAADLVRATVEEVEQGSTAMKWALQVTQRNRKRDDFAPGMFAAASQDMRDRWISELTVIIESMRTDPFPTLLRRHRQPNSVPWSVSDAEMSTAWKLTPTCSDHSARGDVPKAQVAKGSRQWQDSKHSQSDSVQVCNRDAEWLVSEAEMGSIDK